MVNEFTTKCTRSEKEFVSLFNCPFCHPAFKTRDLFADNSPRFLDVIAHSSILLVHVVVSFLDEKKPSSKSHPMLDLFPNQAKKRKPSVREVKHDIWSSAFSVPVMKIVSLTSLRILGWLVVWKHWPAWWKTFFYLRCKQEIYGGIFKRWNTSQNSKPQAKGCYILPWHNFPFNRDTKEKIHESSPEFEVVSVLKRNLARPFFFPSFNDSLSHFGGRRRRWCSQWKGMHLSWKAQLLKTTKR